MQANAMMAAVPTAVPGGNRFQFFPVQVGATTPYARSRRWLFVGVSIYQLLMAIMALIEFANFLSGIVMLFGCLVALWAFKEDMNITYVCWWGVVSAAGFIAGIVGAFIGFAVQISTIVVKFNIPLSCFFGMVVAWWLYADYEMEHPESNDMVGSWLRASGLLKPKAVQPMPQYGAPNLSAAQLSQVGGSAFDSIKGNMAQAPAYGAMGQDKMGFVQAKAQEGGFAGGFGSLFGTAAPHPAPGSVPASAPGGQAQAQGVGYGGFGALAAGAGGFGALAGGNGGFGNQAPASQAAPGTGDLRHNPFMTHSGALAGGAAGFHTLAGGYGGFGSQAPASQAAPGTGDLRRDPFMTHSSLK